MKKPEQIVKNILLNFLLWKSKPFPNTPLPKLNSGSRILCISLNRIGDALISTPLLRTLKKHIGCTIDVLADKNNHFIFEHNSDVHSVLLFKKKPAEPRSLLKTIAANRYEVLLDLNDVVSTTVSFLIAKLAIPYKFGFYKKNNILYTHTLPVPDVMNVHIADRVLSLAGLFGIPPEAYADRLHYECSKESLQEIDSFLSASFPVKKPIVCVNISAGSPRRYWGAERFKSVLAFLQNYDLNTLVTGSPGDTDSVKSIAGLDVPYLISPEFDKFAAIISRSNLLFTPDTSAVHVAAVFKVPVFGLYMKWQHPWSPYNTLHELVMTEEETLHNLSIETVIPRLKTFIEGTLRYAADTEL